MSIRRTAESRAETPGTTGSARTPTTPPTQRHGETAAPSAGGARSLEEAEARYVASRDAWTAAMRAANSGRAADLASLAMAQEAYEQATTEVQLWRTGAKVPIPIEPERRNAGLEAAIGQEMAWRQVHAPKANRGGPLARLARKISGRS